MPYSQHGEDQTIDQLLGSPANGFYIDVGAHHPDSDTVTKYFYEKGWDGINIEPQGRYYEMLCNARPRDINLNVAAGSEPGELQLALGDGLSTFVDKYAHDDWAKTTVPVWTLKDICDRFVLDREIDFLKIDVEGWEREVLLGMDFEKYRPKVLCIEATVPMSHIPTHDEWEELVIRAGYKFVQADIVNRYYVRQERKDVIVLNQIGLLGDATGSILLIIEWAKQGQVYLLASNDPSAEQLYNMIPKKYNVKTIWDIPVDGKYEVKKFDLSHAFAISHPPLDIHMSQAHFVHFGLPCPPKPIRAELEFSEHDVPVYDYILCPYSRCLPDHQKWQQEKWNELIAKMPDRTFAIFGNSKYDSPDYISPMPNVTYEFSRPLDEVMNIIQKVRYGLVSGSTGPSHFAHALGTRNFLFINQGAFAKNPDAVYFDQPIHSYSVDTVLATLRAYEDIPNTLRDR